VIQAQEFEIIPNSDSLKVVFQNESEIREFSVYRGYLTSEEIENKKPIIGKTHQNNREVVFYPLVPFSTTLPYTVLIDNICYYFKLEIPEDYTYLKVIKILPSTKQWPENMLKFHIQFNKAVSLPFFYNHIQFISEDNDLLAGIILDLGQILVNDEDNLVTLWIEPGRQKRGIDPNVELDSPLKIGKNYSIRIKASLKDKRGIPMQSDYSHPFQIKEADRTSPKPEKWKIKTPLKDSTFPIEINLQEDLDYKSVLSSVKIQLESKTIKGRLKYQFDQQKVLFYPNLPWEKGNYLIFVDKELEDLAGNNLERLFDEDIKSKTKAITNYTYNFTIE
jgi:hypothetical protein